MYVNIVIITEYYPQSLKSEITGGVEAASFYVSQKLGKKHSVTVICSYSKGLPREDKVGTVTVYRTGPHHNYSNQGHIKTRLSFAHAAYRKAKTMRHADVIIGYNFLSYLPAYRAAKKTGAKAVAIYHEVWAGKWIQLKGLVTGIPGEMWERIALSRSWDHIISVSKTTKHDLLAKGINEKKITVIPNGVNISEFQNIKGIKKPFSIICVNRLVRSKHPDVLLAALANIKHINESLYRQLSCTFVGDGDDADHIKKEAEILGVVDKVTFTGFIANHHDVLTKMKESALLVNPSSLEGFGIVLIEALALQTPVICSDIPVFREVTTLAKSGTLFRTGDAQDLAEKIISFFSSKQKAIPPMDKFDWKAVAKKTENVLQKIA